MAETDFSSSSPLAGSFLTGRIYPCRRDALSRWPGLYLSVFAAATESFLCGCFTLRRCLDERPLAQVFFTFSSLQPDNYRLEYADDDLLFLFYY